MSDFDPMTEAEFNALEVGDEVRHEGDAKPREVLGVSENPFDDGYSQVQVQRGTIGRNSFGHWEVVDK